MPEPKTILDMMHAQVARFNAEIAGMPMPSAPTRLSPERKRYGFNFLEEELTEFSTAETIEDEVDALVDLIYVAHGRLLEMGVLPGPAFEQVHEANMRKRAGVSKRNGAFDTVKPDGWTPPSFAKYLDVTLGDLDQVLAFRESPEMFHLPARRNPYDNSCVRKPKILVIGYARHGKDTVAEMLRDEYGLTFTSSSMFCAENIMLPYFREKERQPGSPIYADAAACFADRGAHRAEWYEQIRSYNAGDEARLAREITIAYDLYCGMRSADELAACRKHNIFDAIIWVDASGRGVPPEPASSCTVTPAMADYVLDNSGPLEETRRNLAAIMSDVGPNL